MEFSGKLFIGGQQRLGQNGTFHAINAATGQPLAGTFGGASLADLEEAADLAWQAFPLYRETALEKRAQFLEKIAELIGATDERLIARTMAETGLPEARLLGERMRTINQLKLFATLVRSGQFMDIRHDKGDSQRKPVAKPDLLYRNIALGPVAVFGASNFPYAFSVAGGDTASALAAGCPVIVKSHNAHPGTSEIMAGAIAQAVAECDMPAGTFSLLHATEQDIAQALVAHPKICAVGFTGSRAGGLAFMEIAAKRPRPIPVYAEMSSINPVIILPEALNKRAEEIATAFIASLSMGAGQFCTSPGLILAIEGPGLDQFINKAAQEIAKLPAQTMLTPAIAKAYREGVHNMAEKVAVIGQGQSGNDYSCQAALLETSAANFLADHSLQQEMFGSASLIVRCQNYHELTEILAHLEGQLTIALHMDEQDKRWVETLRPLLEITAGRLLINGFGTGVEVSAAMVHGGPYPATSDGRSTSVGTAAIFRFLRPVCYQDFSPDLWPKLAK